MGEHANGAADRTLELSQPDRRRCCWSVQARVNAQIDADPGGAGCPQVRRALGQEDAQPVDLTGLVNARITGLSVVVTPAAVATVAAAVGRLGRHDPGRPPRRDRHHRRAPTTGSPSSPGRAPSTIRRPRSSTPRFIARMRERHGDDLEIVMRTYTEKPRTEVDWKGFAYDPFLDGSSQISVGLIATRMLMGAHHRDGRAGRGGTAQRADAAVRQRAGDLQRRRRAQRHRPDGARTGVRVLLRRRLQELTGRQHRRRRPGRDRRPGRRTSSSASTGTAMTAQLSTTGNDTAHVILRGDKSRPELLGRPHRRHQRQAAPARAAGGRRRRRLARQQPEEPPAPDRRRARPRRPDRRRRAGDPRGDGGEQPGGRTAGPRPPAPGARWSTARASPTPASILADDRGAARGTRGCRPEAQRPRVSRVTDQFGRPADRIGRYARMVDAVARPFRQQIDDGILDRAAALFARRGFGKTSVQDVADAVGLSKAGLLHHFPSKDALYEAVLAQADVLGRRALGEVVHLPAGPGRDRRAIEVFVDVALAHPGVVALMLAPATQAESADPDAVDSRLLLGPGGIRRRRPTPATRNGSSACWAHSSALAVLTLAAHQNDQTSGMAALHRRHLLRRARPPRSRRRHHHRSARRGLNTMAGLLSRLGLFSHRHRLAVVLVWLVVLVAAGVGAGTLSGKTVEHLLHPRAGVDHRPGADRARSSAPARHGATAQVVLEAPAGQTLTDAGRGAGAVEQLVARLRHAARRGRVGHRPAATRRRRRCRATSGPAYSTVTYGGAARRDHRRPAGGAARGRRRRPRTAASPSRSPGRPSTRTPATGGASARRSASSLALVVLAITYGSLVAAGMNLLTAIVGVGIGAARHHHR